LVFFHSSTATPFVQNFYWHLFFAMKKMPFKFHKKFFLDASLSEKAHVFFSISTFPQTTSLSNIKKSSDARTNRGWFAIIEYSAHHGGIAFPP
jgi:hypothetical protein